MLSIWILLTNRQCHFIGTHDIGIPICTIIYHHYALFDLSPLCLFIMHLQFPDELDSFMYQTVGHMGIEILASAMGLPLYRRETKGKSTQTGKQYVPTDDDEVEDLYSLLETCKVIDCLMIGRFQTQTPIPNPFPKF